MIDRRYLYIALAGFGGVIILILLFVLVTRVGKVPVSIQALPNDAVVKIDGKEISTGDHYLPAGEYSFTASKEGWSTDTLKLTIDEDNADVALLLSPQSDQAKAEYEGTTDTDEREQLSSIRSNSKGKTVTSNYPVIAKLPYSDSTGPYKIDYGYPREDSTTPYILISFSTPNGRTKALRWLSEQKLDITNTEIVFSDFENPLKEVGDFHE